jgi:hypothetical protein
MSRGARPALEFAARHAASLIIAVAVLVRLPLLFAPLTYSSDVWRQADTASIARLFARHGYRILYPQIYWGGTGPGYVESEFQLYPFLTALLYAPFGERLWLGRAVSLGMFSAGCFAFASWVRRVAGREATLMSLLLYAFAPLSLRYSVAFMPEATVLCFFVTALWLYDRWGEEPRGSLLSAASLSTAAALLVKPTSISLGPAALATVVARRGWSVLRAPSLWVAAAASLVPATLWLIHANRLYRTYGNTFGLLSGGDSKFPSVADLSSPDFYWRLAHLDLTWVAPGFVCLVCLWGSFEAYRRRETVPVLVGCLSMIAYYVAVGRYASRPFGIQYHVYVLPFASVCFGLGWAAPPQRLPRWLARLSVLLAVASLIAAGGVVYRRLLNPPPNDEVACGVTVGGLVPPGARVIVVSSDREWHDGIPNNYQDPIVFFYADRFGWSLPTDGLTIERVERHRREGASYLVAPVPALIDSAPDLTSHLAHTARVVRPGESCRIYAFEPRLRSYQASNSSRPRSIEWVGS